MFLYMFSRACKKMQDKSGDNGGRRFFCNPSHWKLFQCFGIVFLHTETARNGFFVSLYSPTTNLIVIACSSAWSQARMLLNEHSSVVPWAFQDSRKIMLQMIWPQKVTCTNRSFKSDLAFSVWKCSQHSGLMLYPSAPAASEVARAARKWGRKELAFDEGGINEDAKPQLSRGPAPTADIRMMLQVILCISGI